MFIKQLSNRLNLSILLTLLPPMVYAKTSVVQCYGLDGYEMSPFVTTVDSDQNGKSKLIGTTNGAEVRIVLDDLDDMKLQRITLSLSFREKGFLVVRGTDKVSFSTTSGLIESEKQFFVSCSLNK